MCGPWYRHLCSALYRSNRSAVSSEQTHIPEHTPGAVGRRFCCGEALLKGLFSVVVLKVKEGAVHSLPPA